MTLPDVSRRRFLGGLAAASILAAAGVVRAAPRPVVVLTAYPDEVVSRFEAAFEKAHPEYRLQIVWRMPHDALPYLRQPGQAGVDVYWSASPRTYAALAAEGALRKLEIDRAGLPERIGKAALADPAGYYTVTEMAGYGFACNTRALVERGLPVPTDWPELAHARYAGLIALPSPARVGFAPPMVEIVLQAWGWDRGWALWSEIAGNSALLERGATFVTDEVASGRRPIGLTIDFFSASAIANGAPIEFRYPRRSGINPAHVAITASAPNPAGARAFVEFVLSPRGQAILAHPDIRKLPVRPAVYVDLPAGQFDPFAAAARGGFDFDSALAQPRQGLTTALFQQALAADHAELVELWRRVHRAEAAGLAVAEARRQLCAAPVAETEAADPALRKLFGSRLEGLAASAATAVETRWRTDAAKRRDAARRILEGAGA